MPPNHPKPLTTLNLRPGSRSSSLKVFLPTGSRPPDGSEGSSGTAMEPWSHLPSGEGHDATCPHKITCKINSILHHGGFPSQTFMAMTSIGDSPQPKLSWHHGDSLTFPLWWSPYWFIGAHPKSPWIAHPTGIPGRGAAEVAGWPISPGQFAHLTTTLLGWFWTS